MRRLIISICIIVFFICILNSKKDEQIRIRIIANSDEYSDQEYKKEVVKYLYTKYNFNFNNSDECEAFITREIEQINYDLNNNFEEVVVTYVNHNFVNKTYNGIVEKNENYKTLLIEIGEAKGENFWGILFSNEFTENENTIIYKSYLLDLFKKGDLNV